MWICSLKFHIFFSSKKHKKIKGRIHSAKVTEIDKEKRVINVEWSENPGETKAKVIDLDDLLSVNPSLVASSDVKDGNSMPAPAKSTKKVKISWNHSLD